MASKLENRFGQEFSAALRRRGALIYPNVASQWSPAGWPDVRVIHRQWSGEIERKGPRTKIDPLQIATMREIALRKSHHLPEGYVNCCVVRYVAIETVEVSTVMTTGELRLLFQCTYDDFLGTIGAYRLY
jgi:hypothetical protein